MNLGARKLGRVNFDVKEHLLRGQGIESKILFILRFCWN